jgi:phosphatidylinositol glycan class Q protein
VVSMCDESFIYFISCFHLGLLLFTISIIIFHFSFGKYKGLYVKHHSNGFGLTSDIATWIYSLQKTIIENELQLGTLFRKSRHSVQRIFDFCGQSALHVLGDVNCTPGQDEFRPNHIHAFTQKSSRYPQIYCPPSSKVTLQVILFERPNPYKMEYHSLTPMSLALEDKTGTGVDGDDMEEIKERKKQAQLVEKLKLHYVTRPTRTEKDRCLHMIIDQINCSYETKELVRVNVGLLNSRRMRRGLSVSERVVESATSAWRTTLRMTVETANILWPLLKKTAVAFMLFWRFLADLMLQMLEWRAKPDFAALKDISATGAHTLFSYPSHTLSFDENRWLTIGWWGSSSAV